jgi:hypothetical protein
MTITDPKYREGMCPFDGVPMGRSDILKPEKATLDHELQLEIRCPYDEEVFNLVEFRRHLRTEHGMSKLEQDD